MWRMRWPPRKVRMQRKIPGSFLPAQKVLHSVLSHSQSSTSLVHWFVLVRLWDTSDLLQSRFFTCRPFGCYQKFDAPKEGGTNCRHSHWRQNLRKHIAQADVAEEDNENFINSLHLWLQQFLIVNVLAGSMHTFGANWARYLWECCDWLWQSGYLF